MTEWPGRWSREFTEPLAVLTHLVELEDEQADILENVLDGTLLGMTKLENLGVQWQKTSSDRNPRMAGYLF